MLVLDGGRRFDLNDAPCVTIGQKGVNPYEHTTMLKGCFKNRISRPLADQSSRFFQRMAHAAFIGNHYGVFVAVYLLGDVSYRVSGIKRSLRRWRTNNEFRLMHLEMQAFQALARRHQPRFGQIHAPAGHNFTVC